MNPFARHSVIAGTGVGLWLALSTAWPAMAHDGHDHGAPPPPVSKTIAPRGDASSDDLELVVVARSQQLILHLDTFKTNAPILGATLDIDTPSGRLTPEPLQNEPGSYVVTAPFASQPGTYNLAITVTANDSIDVLAVTLTIPASTARDAGTEADQASVSTTASAQQRTFAFLQAQWPVLMVSFLAGFGLATLIKRRSAPQTAASVAMMVLVGMIASTSPSSADKPPLGPTRDIAQRFPDGALFVPKPTQRIFGIRTIFTEQREHRRTVELPGRIIPSPNASGLVQASVGGRLAPPPGGFMPLGTRVATGDVLAYVQPPLSLADATSQGQQSRELDQQIAIVSRKIERLRAIERIIARSQLEDAELELKGLLSRRGNLDRARIEPEALRAPVDGVLAAANAVAGQMAEPNAIIFHIIDPSQLWVEALSYEATSIQGDASARLANGTVISIQHIGTGFTDRNQAIPIQFSIKGPVPNVRAGQFATVLAPTTEVRPGIAVPRAAILRAANGQSLVYEHSNAERFVPREVRVEPLDGANVLIVSGIEAGRRLVTQGAELLNQIR